jgi:hypothetical protein
MIMPDRNFHKPLWSVLPLAVLITLACSIPSFISRQASGVTPSPESISTSGAVLPDPSAGLVGLKGYHAVLNQTISGSLDGQSYQSQTLVEYSRAASNDEDLVREITVTGSREYYMNSARIGGAYYTQAAKDVPCQGGVLDPQAESLIVPSSRLVAIISADKTGSETINGIPSDHYRFTQTGMPIIEKEMSISGEVWIANPGGYVVKYLLTSPIPTNPSGNGMKVGWNWDYELTQVNAVDQISLPPGCAPVPLEIPPMDDAENILRIPGLLVYNTPSDSAKVIDFYNKQLQAAGWKKDKGGMPNDNDDLSLLYYERESQILEIVLDKSNGTLEVSASMADRGESATETLVSTTQAGGPTIISPVATVDPSHSGLPDDIPLYTGATNLVNAGPMIKFDVTDSLELVAKFYNLKMPANGWKLMTENSSSPGLSVQVWTKDNRITSITINTQSGTTAVMVMTTNQ